MYEQHLANLQTTPRLNKLKRRVKKGVRPDWTLVGLSTETGLVGHTNESGLHALAPSQMLCLTRLISRPPYVLRVPAVQQTRCTVNGAHEESLLELDVVRLVLQSGLGCSFF